MKKLLFQILVLTCFSLKCSAQEKKTKIIAFYLPWRLEVYEGRLTEEDVRDFNINCTTKYLITDSVLIIELEKLLTQLKPVNSNVIDPRMVLDISYPNGKIKSVSVGELMFKGENIEKLKISPPLIEKEGKIFVGRCSVKICDESGDHYYLGEYEFVKFIFDHIPLAKEW